MRTGLLTPWHLAIQFNSLLCDLFSPTAEGLGRAEPRSQSVKSRDILQRRDVRCPASFEAYARLCSLTSELIGITLMNRADVGDPRG